MAVQVLSDFSDALSQLFAPLLQRQVNRQAVLLSLLQKRDGKGKNNAWDVTFSGITGASTYTEGADVGSGDLQQDIKEDAILAWASYRRNFGISGLARAASSSSMGNAIELLDMIVSDGMDSASKLVSDMNVDLYTGTGASNSFFGLNVALATTGTYATIDKAVRTEWQGNNDNNSAVDRALTKSLLDLMERSIFESSGLAPDLIVTTPAIASKYESLLDAITRQMLDSGELSPRKRGLGSPVTNEAGYTGLDFKGIPIYRDKDAPAGNLYMLNTENIFVKSLPQGASTTAVSMVQRMLEDDKMKPSGLNGRMEALAKTGDADKFTIKLYPQLEVKRPNASGRIEDIDES